MERPGRLSTSQSALYLIGNQPDTLLGTELQSIVDALGETSRKTSTNSRGSAFERLIHLATHAHCPALLAEHLDELTEATMKGIREDHPLQAVQALSLTVMAHMTCGPFLCIAVLSSFARDTTLPSAFRVAVYFLFP